MNKDFAVNEVNEHELIRSWAFHDMDFDDIDEIDNIMDMMGI